MEDIGLYENLANEIVIQAVKDLRSAYRKLLQTPDNKSSLCDVRSLERFFRSQWFGVLTNVDGNMIIRKIKEEEEQRRNRNQTKNGGADNENSSIDRKFPDGKEVAFTGDGDY